jgi:hypothetical protein
VTYADYYLRFPDEATATATIGEAYAYVDTIGVMYDDAVTPPTPYDGWHVNVRVIVGTESVTPLVPYAITPSHPRRMWSGGMFPAPLPAKK